MARLKIAGIGAGYFSRFHLEGWRTVPYAEVVAWCDTETPKAAALAAEFGVPRTFSDPATMLDACTPDLVDIVTPPPSHAALVALAHARGIAAISQKPMEALLRASRELRLRFVSVEHDAAAGGMRFIRGPLHGQVRQVRVHLVRE